MDQVDELVVSNPSKMIWIYRTAKKTDRIDIQFIGWEQKYNPVINMTGLFGTVELKGEFG